VQFSLSPGFPGCSAHLAERGIVWDLWRLMDSVRRPGAYAILNCTCGYPPDAGLEERVCVSHPDEHTVVWELDFKGLAPAIDTAFNHPQGFMRLVFDRTEYEADVRAMLRAVRMTASTPVPIADLSTLKFHAGLEKEYPRLRYAVADLFEPTVHGECDAEEFLALDAEAPWPREPLFTPDTLFEVGFFGTNLFRINGKTTHDWIGRWFTRWDALAAFCHWQGFTRRFALRNGNKALPGDPNEFILELGYDAETCHRTGYAFASALQRCLSESRTAPDVKVRYVRQDLAATID
jgi:hypothetical protein